MSLSPYYLGCSGCRLCEGAAYQLPPFLFAGSEKPSILVIAQNPGEIGSDKENAWRFKLKELAVDSSNATVLRTIYDVDFVTSYGHTQMSRIFGEGWLTNGRFMYTNAVRCRTPKNASPSEQMVQNCMGWTAQLPVPPLVVLMGKVAVRQYCMLMKKSELDLWKLVTLKHGQKSTKVLTIPHYAAMRSHADMELAKEMFEQALVEADL